MSEPRTNTATALDRSPNVLDEPARTLDEAALGYAARGWPIFAARGKVPALAGGGGLRDATTDADIVRAMWARFPGANIAVRPARGVVVLDVDPRDHGGTNLVELLDGRPLPPTLTCNTGGGGLHIYYRMGMDTARRDLCPGVQLKAHATGYLIAPPSIHPDSGRRYLWANRLPINPAPDWLIELCRKPQAEALPRPSLPSAPPARGQHRRLAGLLDMVLAAPVGERNNRLHWAACRAGEHIAAGRLDADHATACLLDAAVAVGLTEGAAEATIASGLRKTAAAA